MKWSEYEQRRRALERQLEADIELIRAAHETRLRALERLWLDLSEENQPSPTGAPEDGAPEAPTVPEPVSAQTDTTGTQEPLEVRKGYGEVSLDIEAVFDSLPEVFDRPELARALGYRPVRTTFYRAIDALVAEGRITVESRSSGRHRTRYRKAPRGS